MVFYGGVLNRSDPIFNNHYVVFSAMNLQQLNITITETLQSIWNAHDLAFNRHMMFQIAAIAVVLFENNVPPYTSLNYDTIFMINDRYEQEGYDLDHTKTDMVDDVIQYVAVWYVGSLNNNEFVKEANKFIKQFKNNIGLLVESGLNMLLLQEYYKHLSVRNISHLMNYEQRNNLRILSYVAQNATDDKFDMTLLCRDHLKRIIDN